MENDRNGPRILQNPALSIFNSPLTIRAKSGSPAVPKRSRTVRDTLINLTLCQQKLAVPTALAHHRIPMYLLVSLRK
jgi:hypothetical protein